MSTSAIGATLDAIRAGLVALPNLAEVNVFSGAIPVEEAGLKCIAFGDGDLREIAFAFGGSRQETWDITGQIRTVSAWQGDTESTIKAARDEALDVFAELETYLNDTYTSTLPGTQITDASISSTFGPEGRVCSIAFTFQILAVKNP